MSKRWSCGTLGEGFQHAMDESFEHEEQKIQKELEELFGFRFNLNIVNKHLCSYRRHASFQFKNR